jgi:hypothetical protein
MVSRRGIKRLRSGQFEIIMLVQSVFVSQRRNNAVKKSDAIDFVTGDNYVKEFRTELNM